MSIFRYYASLRTNILEIANSIERVHQGPSWYKKYDNTKPNWLIRQWLESLYEESYFEAKIFGLYIVTLHCNCPNPKHEDYPVTNRYGLNIKFNDERYIWETKIYQGLRNCVCSCSSENKTSEHDVIDYRIYEKSADYESIKTLDNIFYYIDCAIDFAEDKKPRSAIREHLLDAVLEINDQLLPEPMDDYIKNNIERNA